MSDGSMYVRLELNLPKVNTISKNNYEITITMWNSGNSCHKANVAFTTSTMQH